MVKKTTNITFDHRREESYNFDRSKLIQCFHNYMRILSPPTAHVHSMIGFNSQNEVIGSFKSHGTIGWILRLTLGNRGFSLP